MARSVNSVTLLGSLGRDCETSFTTSGIAVTKFSVATERVWKDKQSGESKKEVDWHNVVIWRAEKLAEYLKKGTKVYLTGRLQTRKWEKDGVTRYSTEVIAEEVILLGESRGGRDSGGGESGEIVSRPRSSQPPVAEQPTNGDIDPDEEVPF